MTTTDQNPRHSETPVTPGELSRIETLPSVPDFVAELTGEKRTGIFRKIGHWINENWLHRGITLGAGTLLVGGVAAGIADGAGAFNGPEQTKQSGPATLPTNTPEATTTPSANPETQTPAEITKSFEMPTGLTPEQKADWIAKNFTRWFNYGQTKAELLAWANDGQASDDGTFLHNAATANSAPIIDGIFVSNPSPALKSKIGTLTTISGDTLNFWAGTSSGPNETPYTRSITINPNTVKVDPSDPNTISFTETEHTNEANNRVSTSLHTKGSIIIDGNVVDVKVTFQNDGTSEKISAYTSTDVNPRYYP